MQKLFRGIIALFAGVGTWVRKLFPEKKKKYVKGQSDDIYPLF